jgi:hypothetical protein
MLQGDLQGRTLLEGPAAEPQGLIVLVTYTWPWSLLSWGLGELQKDAGGLGWGSGALGAGAPEPGTVRPSARDQASLILASTWTPPHWQGSMGVEG